VLWYVERKADGWSEPVRFAPEIPAEALPSGVTNAADGTVYFSCRNLTEPGRSRDIYRARLVDGGLVDLENVAELNSAAPEHSPYVAPDGSLILFSSFRGGRGRSDLFVSFGEPDGKWSVPLNMGTNVNSAAKDEYPRLSPDGRWLFFNSNRISALNDQPIPDGPGNMFRIDARVIEDVRRNRP
jgi:hypothetical protein